MQNVDKKYSDLLKKIIHQMDTVGKLINEEIKQPSGMTEVFQTYYSTICIQYVLSKMRTQILKSLTSVGDRILSLFNNIYRQCIEVDVILYEIRKIIVTNNVQVSEDVLSDMNKKICALTGSTLKYRLWNMLRFFKGISVDGSGHPGSGNYHPGSGNYHPGVLNCSGVKFSLTNRHWSEQLFTHRLRTTGTERKPNFTQNAIIIINDSPIVYKNADVGKDFNKRNQVSKYIKHVLRESQNYNQHGLKYKQNFDKNDALNFLNELDSQMEMISKQELINDKKGITIPDVRNPLKYFEKKKSGSGNYYPGVFYHGGPPGKYSIWLKYDNDCYWQVCDKSGLTEWDDLSDVPNYIGIAGQLKKSVVDGGYLFNRYLETWEELNKLKD